MSEGKIKEPWVVVLLGAATAGPGGERLAASGAGDLLASCWRAASRMTRSERLFVLCSEELEPFVLEYTPGLGSENLILEPDSRGTAPAIALAMVQLALAGATTHDPVLILRADGVASDEDSLCASLGRAMEACVEHPALVAVATPAVSIDGYYGWLGLGAHEEVADRGAGDGSAVCRVLQVKVQPGYAEAAQYRDSGKWLCATGVLAVRHGYMGYIMGEVCEELDVAMLLAGCLQQADTEALAAEYALMPAGSFEEAVLAGAPAVLAVELGCEWQRSRAWELPALPEA